MKRRNKTTATYILGTIALCAMTSSYAYSVRPAPLPVQEKTIVIGYWEGKDREQQCKPVALPLRPTPHNRVVQIELASAIRASHLGFK